MVPVEHAADDVAKRAEGLRRVAGAHVRGILAQGHVARPLPPVLEGPVLAQQCQRAARRHLGGQAAQEGAQLLAGRTLREAVGQRTAGRTSSTGPAPSHPAARREPASAVLARSHRCSTRPPCASAVGSAVCGHRRGLAERLAGGRIAEEQADVLQEAGLVGLDREEVLTARCVDPAAPGLLAVEGVAAAHAPTQQRAHARS